MKTLLLKASPRPDGNTATLADHFVTGLHAAGCDDIAEFKLNELTLRPCQACNACLKPPYSGCVLEDDFMTIFPGFRAADLVVFAAPIYWWHVCSQLKTFVDRMHPMLTFDRDHGLPTKHLVFITAYFAEDPYGVGLAVKMFESIAGWAGMGLDILRYHSAKGHVRNDSGKLAEAYALGASFANWRKPTLNIHCPVAGCGFAFPTLDRLALHLVMAAGDDHLRWKSEYLSAVHTLSNTPALTAETRRVLTHLLPDAG
jgi:multimeric flavodoxin WrbA